MVRLYLRKSLSEQKSLELTFKLRWGGKIPQTGTGSQFQTDGEMEVKELLLTDFKFRKAIFKSFSHENRRGCEVWYAHSEEEEEGVIAP